MENKPKLFTMRLQVGEDDLDQLVHVNNVVYLRWVQDVAEAHWLSLADDKTRNAMAWVVLRHEIDYKKPALVNEQINLTTWVGETEGVRSVRYVRITDVEGNILATARTTWCMIDPSSQKPKRISEEIKSLFIIQSD